jgi:hypothetical protein
MRKWPERYRQAELVLMADGRLEEIRDAASARFNDAVEAGRGDASEASYYELLVGATSDILLERDSAGSTR